jgi:hypothetical protein
MASPHDLHLLEEQRAAGAERVLALGEFLLEADRADLPAGERDVGNFLGHPDPAIEVTFSGTVKLQATPFTSGSSRP